ncbi:MAG: hypothetical protein HY054_09855 [Proteobacteria bacterium]|nr:hypothetical protein [Pseudomonadota bacterium]
MKKRWALLLATVAMAAMLGRAAPARAITVIDPTNLAQNILQVEHAVEQIHNQVLEIEQQARMLATNPLQLSPELTQSIAQMRQLLHTAQGLAMDAQQIGHDLKALYPDTWANFDLDQVGARTQQWLAEDRASLERSMQAEAAAAAQIEATQNRIGQALQSSSDAQGQTGAVQASNQLLGINAAQLTEIHALLVAQGRALDTERMERVAREQRAQEITRRAFPTQSSGALTPARSAFDE